MSPPRRRHDAPSWLGTIIVATAVVIMVVRAAVDLQRSVRGRAPIVDPGVGQSPDGGAAP